MNDRLPPPPTGPDRDAELHDRTRRALGRLRDIAPTATADLTGATSLGDRRRNPLLAVAAALVVLAGIAGMIHLSGRAQAPGVAEQPGVGVSTSEPATTTTTAVAMTTAPVLAPDATDTPAFASESLADLPATTMSAPPATAPTPSTDAPSDTAPPIAATVPFPTAGPAIVVSPLTGSGGCGEPTFEIVPVGGAPLEEVVAADGAYVWRWSIPDGMVEAHWPEWQPLYDDVLVDDTPVADTPVAGIDGSTAGAGDPTAGGLMVGIDEAVFGGDRLTSSVVIAATSGVSAAFEIEATLDPPRCPVSFVLFDAAGSALGSAAILPGERTSDAGDPSSFDLVVTAPLISATTAASGAALAVAFSRRGMCDLYGWLPDDAVSGHATSAEALRAVVASISALPTDGYVEVDAGESMVGYLLGTVGDELPDAATADVAVLVERRANGTWSVTEAVSTTCPG